MLDHIDELDSGLCGLVSDMESDDIISFEEWDFLRDILDEESENHEDAFWFPRGEKSPRIKWLNDKIASL